MLAEAETRIAEDFGPFCPLPIGMARFPQAAMVVAFTRLILLTPAARGWS